MVTRLIVVINFLCIKISNQSTVHVKHIILGDNYASVKKKRRKLRHRRVQTDNDVRTQEKMVFCEPRKEACNRAFLHVPQKELMVAQMVKNPPVMQETWV